LQGSAFTADLKKKLGLFPLFPDDFFVVVWNVLLLIMLVLTVVIIPFRVAFINFSDAEASWLPIDITFDVFFGLDIVINFILVQVDHKNRLITSYSKIAKNYLQGFFLIDLVSVIPFEDIFTNFNYN
jgi:hypothetical protein